MNLSEISCLSRGLLSLLTSLHHYFWFHLVYPHFIHHRFLFVCQPGLYFPGSPGLMGPAVLSLSVSTAAPGETCTVIPSGNHAPSTYNRWEWLLMPPTGADCYSECLTTLEIDHLSLYSRLQTKLQIPLQRSSSHLDQLLFREGNICKGASEAHPVIRLAFFASSASLLILSRCTIILILQLFLKF